MRLGKEHYKEAFEASQNTLQSVRMQLNEEIRRLREEKHKEGLPCVAPMLKQEIERLREELKIAQKEAHEFKAENTKLLKVVDTGKELRGMLTTTDFILQISRGSLARKWDEALRGLRKEETK